MKKIVTGRVFLRFWLCFSSLFLSNRVFVSLTGKQRERKKNIQKKNIKKSETLFVGTQWLSLRKNNGEKIVEIKEVKVEI